MDCSDPRYSDVGYAELGGDYYGACEDREGSFVCAVGEKDGKVVAVFGICWD